MDPDASHSLAEDALQFFLNFYRAHALEHTRLYPGVREMIERLSESGHQQAVLTNKPVRISFDIIRALGLQSFFLRVYGGDSFPEKKPEPIGVQALMQETDCSTDDTYMVGDSGVDVLTARNAGVRSCGVTWGFQPEAFDTHPPDVLITRPQQLVDLLT
jgi:phosphoglycolate phosphatase